MPEKKAEFLKYYESERFEIELRLPHKPSFHHFRFDCFSDRHLFKRLRKVVKNKETLRTEIIKDCPKNIFFTPVKWLDPINVRRKKDKEIQDYMLSSPLYFDVDAEQFSERTIGSAIKTAQELIQYLEDKEGLKPDWIIFSGKRGFHIYYWNWDDIPKRYGLANERIEVFTVNREKILNDLARKKIFVDNSVTPDPWRVLRVPGTLHGDTGLIAKAFKSLEEFSIEKTKPS
jgi:DNA primase catalytic subunit